MQQQEIYFIMSNNGISTKQKSVVANKELATQLFNLLDGMHPTSCIREVVGECDVKYFVVTNGEEKLLEHMFIKKANMVTAL